MTAPASGSTEQVEYILDATKGFDLLLDDSVEAARSHFKSQGTSAAHGVGLGITSFLCAALSQEDSGLSEALDVLVKAETAAAAAGSSTSSGKTFKTVYPPGTEYKLLSHDAAMAQSLVHIMAESYMELMKATYKLNRAYKGFKNVYQIVFPTGVSEDESLEAIFTKLNTHYHQRLTTPVGSSFTSGGGFFGWGRKKHVHADTDPISRPSSAVGVTRPAGLASRSVVTQRMAASEPVSREGSVRDVPGAIETANGGVVVEQGEQGSFPSPAWAGDPLTTLVISGAAFGYGLFGLIFSILPPKTRKLISWFGFSNSNRQSALKLLTVAASTGTDVHGYFASLSLLTFYCVVLLMSGWQAEEQYLIDQCTLVLDRVIERFPNGTLWVLNRAKLCRMKHQTLEAIKIIEAGLDRDGPQFREAQSLLVFELSWLYLCDTQWTKAADSFERMCTLNNWSHSTYLSIAAGCLIDMPKEDRTPEIETRITNLYDKLPSLFGQKRLLGEPPSTEIFIMRRLASEKAKHARWVAAGRLSADAPQWHVTRISFAFILGSFWATIGGRSPPPAIEKQIAQLTAFTPHPNLTQGGGGGRAELGASDSAHDDLDTIDEVAMRDLLLGALYRSQDTRESLRTARQLLQGVVDARARLTEERWVVPFAHFELAVIECKLGTLDELDRPRADQKSMWRDRSKRAEKHLEDALAIPEYDLKSRLESRIIMLRDEIATKKGKVGL